MKRPGCKESQVEDSSIDGVVRRKGGSEGGWPCIRTYYTKCFEGGIWSRYIGYLVAMDRRYGAVPILDLDRLWWALLLLLLLWLLWWWWVLLALGSKWLDYEAVDCGTN